MAVTDVELIAPRKTGGGFWNDVRTSFSAHGIFFSLAVFYYFTFKVLQFFNTRVVEQDPIWTFFGMLCFSIAVTILAMVLIQFYHVAAVDHSQKPLQDLWRRVNAVLRHRETMARGIPMYLSLLIFMYTFTVLKANITNFIPFAWDVTFDDWDKALHFGTRPWEWLQPVFGSVAGTFFLNLNYNLWFIVMQVFWIYFAFIHTPGLDRSRFYISFFLVWSIGGSLLATLFSSAGPCYFHLAVDGQNPYSALMQQLHNFNTFIPIWAVDTQAMLWELRSSGSAMGGVTAMPSMHNATALLFVLATWNRSKLLRNLLIVHMILIFLGSIHLAWHYAVDAYFAWAITLVLWVAAHKIALWWERRPRVQAYNAQYAANVSTLT
jgi:PAP2 superfamily